MVTLYFDGSVWPSSPEGIAVSGFVITQGQRLLESFSGIIGQGIVTSLQAEYRAVAEGLRAVSARWTRPNESLTVHGDSKNVIYQLSGTHADPKFPQEYFVAKAYVSQIRDTGMTVTFEWLPREKNLADEVCKRFRKV